MSSVRAPRPAVVLHLWGLPVRRVPVATARAALGLRALRRDPAVRFAKLLGTGSGETFALADADLRHWGVLTVWEGRPGTDPADGAAGAAGADGAARADAAPLVRRLDAASHERLRVTMAPIAATGSWSGCAPFATGREPSPAEDAAGGPVAALTRARLRPGRVARFRRAVPPVAADLHRHAGLRLAVGIGETPLLHQGTFSLWSSADALAAFARGPVHREVVTATPGARWYVEEAFARLAVTGVEGTYRGVTP